MEDSILKSTKKYLGIEEDLTAFDLEITSHINSAFSSLKQIGVGSGTPIEDTKTKWSEIPLPDEQISMVKTFVFKKVKLSFDPPTTSFLIDILKDQIKEEEWRLNTFAEATSEEVTSP